MSENESSAQERAAARRRLRADAPLTTAQTKALQHVRQGQVTARSLETLLGIGFTANRELIAGLERRGLIEWNEDRRRYLAPRDSTF